MEPLAVIGFDIQFGDVNNIDQFDRVLFDAQPQQASEMLSAVEMEQRLEQLTQQLALRNDRTLWVVIGHQASLGQLPFAHCLNVPSILAAFSAIGETKIEQYEAIILVAAHTCSKTTSQIGTMHNHKSFALDTEFVAYPETSGFVALALTQLSTAHLDNHYVYATLNSIAFSHCAKAACEDALGLANIEASDVGLVETMAIDNGMVEQEYAGLVEAYQSADDQSVAIGSLRAITGEGHSFSELAGLLKTVIAVYQCYFPGSPQWHACRFEQAACFFVSPSSHPWYSHSSSRFAAYHCMTDNQFAHVIVGDNPKASLRPNGYLAHSHERLVLLSAPDGVSLQKALHKLFDSIDSNESINTLAFNQYKAFNKDHPFKLCFIASDKTALKREMDLAVSGVEQALTTKSDWKTPKGSYFTASPQADNVCFMFPGIGASYIGLGQSLFHLFPALMPLMVTLTEDIGQSMKDQYLMPRLLNKPDKKTVRALEHALRNNLPDIAECGVAFACVYSAILRKVFKISPHFATGYSMGEVSMYAALDVWKTPVVMSQRLKVSTTFNQRLTGELLALDESWSISNSADRQWETYSVKANKESIEDAITDLKRAYCTIINTHDNLILAGHPEDCQLAVSRLGVKAIPLDMANAIHSPPALNDYDAMVELYQLDVQEKISTQLYSSSCYLPIPQFPKAIANSIAKCLCDPVNFPRLIETLYDKGARVFIEVGPGRSLSNWTSKILSDDKPHASLPMNAKGVSDELTIMRALAKLISHGINADMSPFFTGSLVIKKDHNLTTKANMHENY